MIKEKAKLAFLGQMIGDALGGRYEFSEKSFGCEAKHVIEKDIGKTTGFLPMLGGGIFDLDPGQITDDTEMAMALIMSIVKGRGIEDSIILDGYRNWYKSEPFDIGKNTQFIFGNAKNTSPNISRQLAKSFDANCKKIYGSENLSNGGLMRISPLAIFAAPIVQKYQDKPTLVSNLLLRFAYADTSLSHSSKDALVASATFLALVAGNIVNGRDDFEKTIFLVKLVSSESEKIKKIVERAMNREKLNPPPTVNIGYLGTALQLAILRSIQIKNKELSFHSALVSTIKLGGDTDTNCAIVGAAIGALSKFEDFPSQWVTSVLDCKEKKFMNARMACYEPYAKFHLGLVDQICQLGEKLS